MAGSPFSLAVDEVFVTAVECTPTAMGWTEHVFEEGDFIEDFRIDVLQFFRVLVNSAFDDGVVDDGLEGDFSNECS